MGDGLLQFFLMLYIEREFVKNIDIEVSWSATYINIKICLVCIKYTFQPILKLSYGSTPKYLCIGWF